MRLLALRMFRGMRVAIDYKLSVSSVSVRATPTLRSRNADRDGNTSPHPAPGTRSGGGARALYRWTPGTRQMDPSIGWTPGTLHGGVRPARPEAGRA